MSFVKGDTFSKESETSTSSMDLLCCPTSLAISALSSNFSLKSTISLEISSLSSLKPRISDFSFSCSTSFSEIEEVLQVRSFPSLRL